MTFSEDYGVEEDPSRQEKFKFGYTKVDIGNTFVRINDFAQDKAFVGLTSDVFDSEDERGIFKLGLIYLTCGDWLPPDDPNASIFNPDPDPVDTDTDTETDSNTTNPPDNNSTENDEVNDQEESDG